MGLRDRFLVPFFYSGAAELGLQYSSSSPAGKSRVYVKWFLSLRKKLGLRGNSSSPREELCLPVQSANI